MKIIDIEMVTSVTDPELKTVKVREFNIIHETPKTLVLTKDNSEEILYENKDIVAKPILIIRRELRLCSIFFYLPDNRSEEEKQNIVNSAIEMLEKELNTALTHVIIETQLAIQAKPIIL